MWIESPRGRVAPTLDNGTFSGLALLLPGEQLVRAICVDASGRETDSVPQKWNVPLRDAPKAWVHAFYGNEGLELEGDGSEPSEATGSEIVQWTWSDRADNPEPLVLLADGTPIAKATGPSVTTVYPSARGDYFVDLTVATANGETDTATVKFRVDGGDVLLPDPNVETPPWVADAIVYGVVPFFFGSGGFADVEDKLDHLQTLGVTVLWLSPVFACPDDDYGYAVSDPFELRETFGDETAFRALVDGAHARDMKVILDFVANHTSDEHRYYVEAEEDGPGSAYWEFYERDANGDAESYFDWDNLKNVDYDEPEVRRYETEAALHWIREYDVDGFRADAAWAVRDRAPDFWLDWRRELVRIKPDLLLLAEATARDTYYFDNGFDVAYDWTWELGDWAWKRAWDNPEQRVRLLEKALLNQGEGGFDDDAVVLHFLDNNDTGARFVTRYGPELVVPATAMLLTIPGVPALFSGEEVGAEYEPYDEAPPISWDDPHGLLPIHQKLTALRADRAALRSKDWSIRRRVLRLGARVPAHVGRPREQRARAVELLRCGRRGTGGDRGSRRAHGGRGADRPVRGRRSVGGIECPDGDASRVRRTDHRQAVNVASWLAWLACAKAPQKPPMVGASEAALRACSTAEIVAYRNQLAGRMSEPSRSALEVRYERAIASWAVCEILRGRRDWSIPPIIDEAARALLHAAEAGPGTVERIHGYTVARTALPEAVALLALQDLERLVDAACGPPRRAPRVDRVRLHPRSSDRRVALWREWRARPRRARDAPRARLFVRGSAEPAHGGISRARSRVVGGNRAPPDPVGADGAASSRRASRRIGAAARASDRTALPAGRRTGRPLVGGSHGVAHARQHVDRRRPAARFGLARGRSRRAVSVDRQDAHRRTARATSIAGHAWDHAVIVGTDGKGGLVGLDVALPVRVPKALDDPDAIVVSAGASVQELVAIARPRARIVLVGAPPR